jgi:dipeptidyl aminopeptidase/acylaminoacyl peptidase
MTNRWGANVENPYNLLPNFGVAVLVLPLPGREGFGPHFYNDLANGRNFGQIDIDEGAQAVEQLIRMGYTSREQVGITGCSYGGYFTSQSITQYPTLYAAANTQCSLLDLVTEWQTGYTPVVSYLEGQPPTVDPAEYTKDSPFFQAAQVQTPLLMFHGTRDFLPIQTAANFHDQVEANGVPVVLLAFQDEGHGLASPISQFTAGQAQVAWFQEFLGVPGVNTAWRK